MFPRYGSHIVSVNQKTKSIKQKFVGPSKLDISPLRYSFFLHTLAHSTNYRGHNTLLEEEISSGENSAMLCAVYLLEWWKPKTKYVSVEALHK